MACNTFQRSFLCLLLAAPAAHAQVFTVGPDAGCTTTSIQAAINAAGNNYTIRITRGATFSAQALTITSKTITLAGGFDTCDATAPSGLTTLSGQGGANDSVLTIRGNSNILLKDLVIVRGDEVSDGYGGGIDYRGFGSLILEDVGVAQNYAGYGGGISVIADGSDVQVELRRNTVVQLNTAQFSGGGIRIEGPVYLKMVEPDTAILGNEALGINPATNQPQYGNGGGLQVIASARAQIGSPGYGTFGAIANNIARYGGGIAVDGSESTPFSAFVSVYSTDPANPTRISGNRASQTGGAVHLLPAYSGQVDNFFSRATLCLWDARIENNSAQQGAAIYGDSDLGTFGADLGSALYVNRTDAGDCAQRPTGAVTCTSPPCTVFSGNRAVDANNQRTGGAAILLQNKANFRLRNAVFSKNIVNEVVRSLEPYSESFEQLLIVDNDITGPAIRVEDAPIDIAMRDSTIANNTMASSPVIAVEGNVAIERFLVAQPGRTVLSASGSRSIVDVLANEIASLGGGPQAVVAAPRFTDPAHGDYLPIAASFAVDFASAAASAPTDLLGVPRDVDIPLHADLRGTRDVGAIERQSVGNLVLNGEFVPRTDGEELRLWAQATTPNIATWSSSEGPPGGAGAVFVAYDPAIDPGGRPEPDGGGPIPRVGLRQCVNLPGPATYSLNAWTKVPGTIAANRDYPRLHWVLRNSSESCTGTPDAEGDVFLQRSNQWTTGAPGEIQLAPGAWTSNSTLEVSLVVYDGDMVGTNLVDAFFDRVELRVSSLEVRDVFKDGFE